MLPKRSQRYLALLLKPVVIPALALALPAWPLLAVACAIPVIGVMAIPILLLISVLLLYAIAWICYLFLAQRDLPATWTNVHRWSPRNFCPFLPINPIRCAKVDLAAFRYTVTAFRLVFPAIFDWSYRRIMVIGTTKGSRVVKEGILYGSPSRGKRLDVYLPAEPPSSTSTHQHPDGMRSTNSPPSPSSNGVPVIVVIPSMLGPLTVTSKRKLYLQLALRLRRMGYCVIVADITYYPESRIKSSVIDLRLVLRWSAKNCQRYGGDPSKIYVLGHGLSAHLVMLTISQEAVVLSREGHLDRAYEHERHMLRSKPGAGTSYSAHTHAQHDEDDEWFKSGEVGTSSSLKQGTMPLSAHTDALDEVNHEPVRLGARIAPRGTSTTATASAGAGTGASAGGATHPASEGWVDETETEDTSSALPGLVMGATGRFDPHAQSHHLHAHGSSTSRKVEEAESILNSSAYRQAEQEVGNGLRRVEIYEPEIELPALAGVILLSGISDVIKGFRSESERGLEHLSFLRRATGPSHFNCLIHSPAHLLYAAKNIVDTRLLPPKFLLVHGGKDQVVPVEQSTLLKTLLVGIGVDHVKLRAYRNLGHAESIACLFLGMARSNTRYTRQISEDISSFVGQ